MMDPRPAIVFVTGACTLPSTYDEFLQRLNSSGYTTKAVKLASVDPSGPMANFDPDVSVIRSAISSFAERDQDVVLMAHSYGCHPSSEAVKGFARGERASANKKGGVVRMMYFGGYMLDEGVPPSALFEDPVHGFKGFTRSEDGNTFSPSRQHVIDHFFNDLPSTEQERLADTMKPQAFHVFESPLTYAAWKHVPATYFVAMLDKAAPIEGMDFMINTARESGAMDLERTELPGVGHFSFLSDPDLVVREVRKAIERT